MAVVEEFVEFGQHAMDVWLEEPVRSEDTKHKNEWKFLLARNRRVMMRFIEEIERGRPWRAVLEGFAENGEFPRGVSGAVTQKWRAAHDMGRQKKAGPVREVIEVFTEVDPDARLVLRALATELGVAQGESWEDLVAWAGVRVASTNGTRRLALGY